MPVVEAHAFVRFGSEDLFTDSTLTLTCKAVFNKHGLSQQGTTALESALPPMLQPIHDHD